MDGDAYLNVTDILFKDESYRIVGCCLAVYNELGYGFKEIVYKEALQMEFSMAGLPFIREKSFPVSYKGRPLLRTFCADFLLFDSIILEVKAMPEIYYNAIEQIKNYLKAGSVHLGIIANFGEPSFRFKRVVL